MMKNGFFSYPKDAQSRARPFDLVVLLGYGSLRPKCGDEFYPIP